MKVLHVDTGRSWRGGQAQVYQLLRHLPESGVEPHLLSPASSELHERLREAASPDGPSTTLHNHPLRGEWDLAAAYRIHRLHRHHGFDLVHCHDSHGHGITWAAKLLFPLPPMIVTRRLELPVAQNWLSRHKYGSVDAFIAISSAVRDSLVDCGIPADSITVIPSGIDQREIDRTPPAPGLARELGLDPDRPLVGNVGALCEQKDQLTFVRAAAKVLKQRPAVQFVIAGQGPLREELEAEIAARDLGDRVVLAGFQRNIIGLIKTFDLFVLTSLYEGLCSTLLQVMACEVPIVASDVGGVSDLIDPGHTGVLVGPGEPGAFSSSILQLLEAPDERQRYAMHAAERALDYDYSRLTPHVADVYRSQVDTASPAAG